MPTALIARYDHLGDLILTTPLVRALARGRYAVDVAVRRDWLPVLEHNPYVRQRMAIDDIAPEFPCRWRPLARWIRSRRYDVLVLPYARPSPLLWASLFSGTPRRVAMWGGVWGRLTAHECLRSGIRRRPRHMAEVFLDCARRLGVEPNGILPDVVLTEAERDWARAVCTERFGAAPVVGLHPGCGGNACNFPFSEYGTLAERLLEKTGAGLLVTGNREEAGFIREWPAAVLRSPRCWNAAGELSLRQLAALLGCLRLLICPSTGPLHLASALGVETLSPFCSRTGLSRAYWGNANGKGHAIDAPEAACRRRGLCRFEGVIAVDELFRRAIELLREPRPAGSAGQS